MVDQPENALDIRFAELLCARLCHDMAGAVGAAAAGAELLEDGFDAETAKMVSDSAGGAVARLKLFRAAFGPAGPEQSTQTVRDLCASYLDAAAASGGGKLVLGWTCGRDRLDGEAARLVLNLVLLARDALPRGGTVDVTIDAASRLDRAGVSVEFRGQGARLDDQTMRCLSEQSLPDGPREAQAWLTGKLVRKIGARTEVVTGENHGRIST
ncbi:hypothetical protein A6A04_01085 [Paramagnetospirillum marisnigri]|uniref:Histidine phosphotransferase ChpT C-terminal domain-containing protein n=1 Tax=Paramagnetospirillum marisnigri TaxID=1285242 RepID=A0A178MSE4_9PROT|nr:histidine phosphotransferase family protein [Paramagnetospirillum marisnigri]OAN52318.1 hypothetical protein A6A04_01085 [Paramagnetospirillum marisnigri]